MTQLQVDLATIISKAKVEGYGIVFDKEGRPRIDDYDSLPDKLKELLAPILAKQKGA